MVVSVRRAKRVPHLLQKRRAIDLLAHAETTEHHAIAHSGNHLLPRIVLQTQDQTAPNGMILADSANDPDDADKPDDLDESDNYDDSDDSLMTSRASYPNCKKSSWPRFPRPGQWPKSDQFLLTTYCKTTIFRPLAAKSPQKLPDRA